MLGKRPRLKCLQAIRPLQVEKPFLIRTGKTFFLVSRSSDDQWGFVLINYGKFLKTEETK